MSQVLRNLVSNALKFTPHGGQVNVTSKFISYQELKEIEDPESSQSSISLKSTIISWFTYFTRSIVDIAKSYVISSSKLSSSSITPSYEGEFDLVEIGATGFGCHQTKGILRVDVQDTGPGISKVLF